MFTEMEKNSHLYVTANIIFIYNSIIQGPMRKHYPDGSLSLSKRIPSEYGKRWASDETLTILPSLPLSCALFFMVSSNRCVRRK